MRVKLAKTAGFCMGVRRAMEILLEAMARQDGNIYTYGPLIHNPQVLKLLELRGIRVVKRPDGLAPGTIVIRAHGIPPAERRAIEDAGLKVIDATCPRVLKVQRIIQTYAAKGYSTVIVGDIDHPEVKGLLGFAGGHGQVTGGVEEVEAVADSDKLIVVAQTTQDEALFEQIVARIRELRSQARVFNTICDSTHRRQAEILSLAESVDAIVVVGGKNSGNTQRLAQISQAAGVATYHIETDDELNLADLAGLESVGVTAGASTPTWMIDRVVRRIEDVRSPGEGLAASLARRLFHGLARSDLLLALGAAAVTYAATRLADLPPRLIYSAVAMLYVFAMHVLNHFTDQEAEQLNDPVRAEFFARHQTYFLTTGILSILAALGLAASLGVWSFLFLLIISILGMIYRITIVPAAMLRYVRISKLKDIPGSKTLFVAVAWAAVSSLLPPLAAGGTIAPPALFSFGYVFVLVYIWSATFDILDIQSDRLLGRETVPVLIGEKRTIKLLQGLTIGAGAFLAAGAVAGVVPPVAYWLLISLLATRLYISVFSRKTPIPRLVFETLVEANFLLAAFLAWLAAA
ncbi:MAG: 4-hydroxy-3-methylbut-2-enyl diphosphate reductase [Pseudomonadota bacterium]